MSAGIFGYFRKPTTIWERLLLIAGGLLLFKPGGFTDLLGAVLIVSAYLSQRLRRS
jgi:TRAP-type uncharacterized transport system fused permease subunit